MYKLVQVHKNDVVKIYEENDLEIVNGDLMVTWENEKVPCHVLKYSCKLK